MVPEDPLVVSITSNSLLHPDEITRKTFPTARRGLDAEAVRRYLESLSNDLRELLEREAQLRHRLADAERRAAEPEIDEAMLTRAVGVETARILETAHAAARDVIANAEARAAQLVEESEGLVAQASGAADEEAAGILARAEQDAVLLAAATVEEATALRATARQEADELIAAAAGESAAVLAATKEECRQMVREARELRHRVLNDLADRRRALRVQLAQLRTGRDSLIEVVDAVGDAVDRVRDRLATAEHEARLAAAEAGDRVSQHDRDEEELEEKKLRLHTGGSERAPVAGRPGETEETTLQPDDRELAMALAVDEALATEDVGAAERLLAAAEADRNLPPPVPAGEDPLAGVPAAEPFPSGEEAGEDSPIQVAVAGPFPSGEEACEDSPPGAQAGPFPSGVEAGEDSLPGVQAAEPFPSGEEAGGELATAVEGGEGVPAVAPAGPTDVAPGAEVPAPGPGTHRSVGELFARLRSGRGSGGAESKVAASPTAPEAPEKSSDFVVALPQEAPAEGAGVLGSSSSHEAALHEPDEDPLGAEEPARSDASWEERAGDEAVAAAALSRRTELLAPVMTRLSRALKRALQDDQNELLDSIRHAPPQAVLDSLLPVDTHRLRYEQAASLALSDAWTVGRLFVTADDDVRGSDEAEKLALAAEEAGREVGAQLALELTGLLRRRLAESFATAGGLGGPAHDITGAAYREWKGPRIEAVAGDFAIAAFSRGEVTAGEGTLIRWVVDDDGQPCPDCDDNSLAGPQPAGEPFPTGQPHPPVHAGCRCLLVPATRAVTTR